MMNKSFSLYFNWVVMVSLVSVSARESASTTSSATTCSMKMTEDELEVYNGTKENMPIYLALSGKVYDVSSSADWYGPTGTYSAFAGRACTRAIALPSLRYEDISDDISDFSTENYDSLKYWDAFFEEKYPVVAILIPDTDDERARRIQKHILTKGKNEQIVEDNEMHIQYSGGRTFSMLDLRNYDGKHEHTENKIYLAIGGHVLDVTKSHFLYGKGNPRECFAGHDITRISAKMITKHQKPSSACDQEDLARGSELIGMTTSELIALKKKVKFFLDKFERVGTLEDVDLILP